MAFWCTGIGTGIIDSSRLATDAVITTKIKDANVTLAKAAPDLLAAMSGGAMVLLGTATGTGAETTLAVTGLTTTSYRSLMVIFDSADGVQSSDIWFNADTTAGHYRWQNSYAENATLGCAKSDSDTDISLYHYSFGSHLNSFYALVHKPLATTTKRVQAFLEATDGTSEFIQMTAGLWTNTADSITSVHVGTGTMSTGASLKVYGIS